LVGKLQASKGEPINVYREEIKIGSKDLVEQLTCTPRDLTQVQNAQKSEKRRWRLTTDAMYNLIKLQGN